MTTLHSKKSLGRSPLRRGLLLIPLAFVCFALTPASQAVTPAPDGGYPGGNTAEGLDALLNLTTGTANTAIGRQALLSTTGGIDNTATGFQTLRNNNGDNNTAIGYQALLSNTLGERNTAVGWKALVSNIGNPDAETGIDNTAVGSEALVRNTTGSENTANGDDALRFNTIGSNNTALGVGALLLNTTGNDNIALGNFAGSSLTMGDSNIDIGSQGLAGDSSTIRIGSSNQTTTFIAGINGVNEGGTVAVVTINGNGQLGTQAPVVSSRRFKKDIKPMDQASEAILRLKPVTFDYKSDSTSTPQFGLIAEEVAEVNPDLIARDDKGEIYTVRYEAVNAMLLNEFLKEHRKVEQQEATIAKQQKQIEALTTGLQKVSDELDLRKPAPQMVVNNQ